MTIAFPATPTQAASPAYTPDNPYATLFIDYISRSLAESLATVRAVETRLPDEARVQACHVLDFGLRVPEAWANTRDLTVALAPYVERSGQWETWNQQLQRAIELAERQQDVDSKLLLMSLLARLAQRQGRLQETIYYYRRVIRLARRAGNRFEEARACSNLGYLFVDANRFLRSEVLCQHALVIFEQLQSNHGLAHTHNHLGLLYTRQWRYALAEQHLQLACELWQCLQDTHSLFYGNLNLGFLYLEIDCPDNALQYLELALQIAENSGEAVDIARAWNNVGLAHLKLGNFYLAEQYFGQAQRLFSQISHDGELAKTHHNLGLTYQRLKQWLDALYHLEIAFSLFQAIQNTTEEMKVLIALVAQDGYSAYVNTSEKYGKALGLLVVQKNDSEFQAAVHAYIRQYCNSFLGSDASQLLQYVAV